MQPNPVSHARAPAGQGPGAAFPPHRILVVEDDSAIRQLNAEALLHAGYRVDAAEDGAMAIPTDSDYQPRPGRRNGSAGQPQPVRRPPNKLLR